MRAATFLALTLLSGCTTMSPEEEEMKQEFARQLTPFLKQLPSTWKRLEGEGVTTETLVELDFVYSMPTEEVATQLSTMLRREFGYKTKVLDADGWRIEGRTGETRLTAEIVQQWLGFMVQRGVEAKGRFESWRVHRSDT